MTSGAPRLPNLWLPNLPNGPPLEGIVPGLLRHLLNLQKLKKIVYVLEQQEPGRDGKEIINGVVHVRPGGGFVPNFILFRKVEVNGNGTIPLYSYLKSVCPTTVSAFREKARLFYDPLDSDDIRWNFEKFLVDRKGKPYKRVHPQQLPETLYDDIARLASKRARPQGARPQGSSTGFGEFRLFGSPGRFPSNF
ncbi:unnamed protein product [Darwinula stevensoni]|uniref:Glutathione peroxidase n=1 Tax=Darwinula stevensoni TaxID=69355 RepID=A0A7R8XM64_9CRUS|nr:unnamed protein product [Darwinula stevensoni]CAG0895185.1 unnamed protein product [Darwinula stevensoni]